MVLNLKGLHLNLCLQAGRVQASPASGRGCRFGRVCRPARRRGGDASFEVVQRKSRVGWQAQDGNCARDGRVCRQVRRQEGDAGLGTCAGKCPASGRVSRFWRMCRQARRRGGDARFEVVQRMPRVRWQAQDGNCARDGRVCRQVRRQMQVWARVQASPASGRGCKF